MIISLQKRPCLKLQAGKFANKDGKSHVLDLLNLSLSPGPAEPGPAKGERTH
jgi:hypothetical protein